LQELFRKILPPLVLYTISIYHISIIKQSVSNSILLLILSLRFYLLSPSDFLTRGWVGRITKGESGKITTAVAMKSVLLFS
jgi:hypothetical protein